MGKRIMPVTQVDPKLMAEIVRRIVDVMHPEKVILFGSHARGVRLLCRSANRKVCHALGKGKGLFHGNAIAVPVAHL